MQHARSMRYTAMETVKRSPASLYRDHRSASFNRGYYSVFNHAVFLVEKL